MHLLNNIVTVLFLQWFYSGRVASSPLTQHICLPMEIVSESCSHCYENKALIRNTASPLAFIGTAFIIRRFCALHFAIFHILILYFVFNRDTHISVKSPAPKYIPGPPSRIFLALIFSLSTSIVSTHRFSDSINFLICE